MALKYHLVSRLDLRREAQEGDRLLYGQVRSSGRLRLRQLCDQISEYTSATAGDVRLIIKGLIFQMREELMEGNAVHLGEFGSFRMSAGSSGTKTEKEFKPHLFKNPRLIFTPGTMLRDTPDGIEFEKVMLKEVTEECNRPHAG